MSIQLSRLAVISIADAALFVPVYFSLKQMRAVRMVGQQPTGSATHVGDDAFAQFVPTGNKLFSLTLNGFSDNSEAEILLSSGFMDNALRLLRFETPQQQQIAGLFWVTRLVRDMQSTNFDAIEAELVSHGEIMASSL